MKTKRILAVATVLALSLLFAACAKRVQPVPAEITLPQTQEVLMGETLTLSPDITLTTEMPNFEKTDNMEIAQPNYQLTYTSADTTIAGVDDAGVITPVAVGRVNITVAYKDVSATTTLTVMETVDALNEEMLPAAVSLRDSEPLAHSVLASDEYTFEFMENDFGEFEKLAVAFTSSDTQVATVSPQGTITAVHNGEAIITIDTGTHQYDVPVRVYTPVTDITLSYETMNLRVGAGGTLKVSAYAPEGADFGTEFSFESADTSIATVTANGYVTAKKAGTTTIDVYNEDNLAVQCKVVVSNTQAPASQPAASGSIGASAPVQGGTSTNNGGGSAPAAPSGGMTEAEAASVCAQVNAAAAAKGYTIVSGRMSSFFAATYSTTGAALDSGIGYVNQISTPEQGIGMNYYFSSSCQDYGNGTYYFTWSCGAESAN